MALDPDELEQIVNAISKGFEKAHASSPGSSSTFKEFDVGFRSTSKRLQDLSEVISRTTKGSAEHNEAQKLFVRTLKGKMDDIASSSGTLKDKMEAYSKSVDDIKNVSDDYKKKLKEQAAEQFKNTQGAKEYKEQLDKVNKSLDIVNKNFAPLGNLIGGIVKSYQSGGSAIGMAGSILSAEVGFVGESAKQLGSGLQSAGAAATTLPGAFRGVGIAAMFVGTGLNLAGKGMSELATKVIPLLTAELDKAYNAFRDISSTGAIFAGGLNGMKDAGKAAGLDLQQFSGVLKQNAEVISRSGLGMSEGARRIGEAFEGDRKAGNKMRQTMLQLGYSYEEQAGLVAETMALMRQSGKVLGPEYDKEIRSETQRYAENLRMISSITGDDAKKRMAQAQQAAAALAFQQKLNDMEPAERKKAIEAMSTLTKDEQQAFMEMTVNNGRAMTKSSAILLEQSPNLKKSLIEYYDAFNNRTLDLDKAGEISARNQKGINDDFMKNKLAFAAMAGVGGDIGAVVKQIEDINQLNQKRTPEAIERAKEERRLAKIQADKDAEIVTLKTQDAERQAAINKQANDILRSQGKVSNLEEDAKKIYDPTKDKDLSITTSMLETVKAGQDLKLQIQDTILTQKVIGNFADAMVKATNDITEAIKKFDPAIQGISGGIGQALNKMLEWGPWIIGGITLLQGAVAAGQIYQTFKGPKSPPPPSSDDTKPKPGPWSPKDNNPTGPAGPKSGPTGPAGGTGNKEPPKPTTKPGIKGKFGAVLNSAATMAGPVLEKSNSLMAGASAVTAALEGNIGGLVESLKDIAAGTKVSGAEAVKPAATTPATEAVKPVAKVAETVAKPAATAASTLAKEGTEVLAKDGAKLAAKEAATLGAKSIGKTILKKLPGIGFLVGLANAGQRAMDGDWVGAGLEVASGTASILPGAGTAASVALDATLAAKDAGLFGKKEKPKTEATTVTPIAEPPVKLPENKPVVPTVPKVAGASVFDRTPGQAPALDPRTNEEKDKFTKAIAEGKSLKSVLDEIKASEKVIASNNPSDANYVSSKVEPVVVEPDSSNPSNPNYVSPKVEPVAAALDPSNPSNPNYEPPRAAMASAVLTGSTASPQVLEEIKNTFANRVKEVAAREADITRTGMLPTQNVAPNNPQVPSDLNAKITEIVAEADKAKAAAVNALTATPSKSTTDDVVAAIEKLAAQFGRAVGLLDDISSHSGSTASNTRKQLQGQQ